MNTNQMQNDPSVRERFALTSEQLLDDYARISSRRKNGASATALRMESSQYRDILAHEATAGSMNFSELKRYILERSDELDSSSILVPEKLAELGTVALLQNFESNDVDFAVLALKAAIVKLPKNIKSRNYRRLLIEHNITTGNYDQALTDLELYPDIDKEYHNYLRAELNNPFRNSRHADLKTWSNNFNTAFIKNSLEPVQIIEGMETAFDGLNCEIELSTQANDIDDIPLVSVIMTTFQPNLSELVTSTRSILNQSITNIELIIVDDSSGIEYREVIESVASSDSRIRILTTSQNSGTYVARNLGFSHARAKFITGQDDDDWSHPRRLEMQLNSLLENPEWAGCRVNSITCDPTLSRVRPRYKPENPNASSLMLRAADFEKIGGFLPIRKGADTELHKRLEIVCGKKVHDLIEPLTIVRIMDHSLSRGDFRSGWSHPARRQFKSSYQFWHASSSPSQLCLTSDRRPPIAVPRKFLVEPSAFPEKLDVVIAGDWRQYGGPQKSMIEEILSLTRAGLQVGILHLEAPRFMSSLTKPMCFAIQELVNSGLVHEVLYDDPVKIRLMVLRYPPILQFVPRFQTDLEIDHLIILANQAPSELDGRDIRYLVNDCHENALRTLSRSVLWVPQGPQVRRAIAPYLTDSQLADFDMPGILNLNEWKTIKNGPRGTIPVVGRHSRDNEMKWPEIKEVITQTYPSDGRFDVRIMGGAKVPLIVLGAKAVPPAWTVYETDEIPVASFLRTLDYFVFFQHSLAVEAFGRSILEAIASGLVVILPPHYEDVFGEAAVYSTTDRVQSVVAKFHGNWRLYKAQLDKAQRVMEEHFSYESYVDRVLSVLESSPGSNREINE